MIFLAFGLMTACDADNTSTFDDAFKSSVKEELVILTIDEGYFIKFDSSGLTYYGNTVDESYDYYQTPFEHMETYEDYTVTFDEDNDRFSIIVDNGSYDLEVFGTRVFYDEENNLNLTSTRDFLNEINTE